MASQQPIPPADAAAPFPGKITAKPDVIDFGDVFDGEELQDTIRFINDGDEDWPVQRVATSCGCTVATLLGPDGANIPNSPRPETALIILAPGEALTVEVHFNTAGQQGIVEKHVELVHIDPLVSPLKIPVKARVSRAIVVSPTVISFSSVGKRERTEKQILVESQDIGPWKISGFETAIPSMPLPDFLSFEVEEQSETSQKIRVILDGARPVGTISAKVRINIEHDRIKYGEFFVSGIVEPDVTFNSGNPQMPKIISFDQLKPGTKTTRTLTIQNRDPDTPYLLQSYDLFTEKSEFFAVEIRAIEKGVHYEVDVTANAAIDQRFFRGTLVLKADHPDLPQKTVPFHGWVPK